MRTKFCGCDFEYCVENNGGVIHTHSMSKDEWECLRCQDRILFEFQEELQRLCEKNKLFLRCDKCGNPMKIVISGVCECGNET